MLLSLMNAGMDVVRLNFSHGTHDSHRETFQRVRRVAESLRKPITILQDLQGPKLRLGKLDGGPVDLGDGEELTLYPEGSVPSSFLWGKRGLPLSKEIALVLAQDVRPGARLLIDDGKVETVVIASRGDCFGVRVKIGGKVSSNKGLNLPDTPLSLSALTEKDLADLELGLELGVDAIALSFVRKADELVSLREKIRLRGGPIPLLISKIERPEAIDDIENIISASDGILIARGDMAVEMGPEHVPVIQKRIIRLCNQVGVPVITATQMLESMIECSTPTRAEASDVANAVFDGTDAVMLSAETASGKYPLQAVETMSRIIVEAETSNESYLRHVDILPQPGVIVDSIEFSAGRIARHVGAVVIGCITHSGMAARTLAKYRPHMPIVAIVDQERVLRQLNLVWGVRGVLIPRILGTDDIFGMVEGVLLKEGWVKPSDYIVVTGGMPTLGKGTTNMVKVHRVATPHERKTTP